MPVVDRRPPTLTGGLRAGMPQKGAYGTLGAQTDVPAMTNTVYPQPAAPTPQGPLPGQAPSPRTFGTQAPTPTAYGNFNAPDPLNFQQDPSYQWRFQQGQKGLERGAAARGTLLGGNFQKALQDYGQQAASQEYGSAFNRALQGYETNRATNAQNFGQQMDEFGGNLGAFGANVNADLGYGRLGLDRDTATWDRTRQQGLDQQDYQQAENDRAAAQANDAAQQNAQAYAQQVANARAMNAFSGGGFGGGGRMDIASQNRARQTMSGALGIPYQPITSVNAGAGKTMWGKRLGRG